MDSSAEAVKRRGRCDEAAMNPMLGCRHRRQHLRLLSVALTTVVVAACQVTCPLVGAAPHSPATVTFADEFDGPTGSPPDPQHWTPDVGGGITGWGNNELQYYTRSGNAFLDGAGNLVIEAARAPERLDCWYGTCEYVSAKVTTKYRFAQRYGVFEARMKAPVGKGLWVSFWLLGNDLDVVGFPAAGEIDIAETLGDRPQVVEQHVQAPGSDPDDPERRFKWGDEHVLPAGQSFADWHTYAVRWTPDLIEWQVDGQPIRTLTKDMAGKSWVFDKPFFILLNLSVGGEWPGSPNDETVFPARLVVDYVRVYALPVI
jgi:beta-glucanase (GH16 family)